MITLGLVTFSWLCFQMNMDNYPTSPSLWMGAFAPRASTARGFHKCCMTHSASSATWPEQVRGQRGDIPQPDGAVDGNGHRSRAG
jgi:hypothetical protein